MNEHTPETLEDGIARKAADTRRTAAEATNVAAMSGRSSRLYVRALERAVSLGPNDERVDAERTQRRILVDAMVPRPPVNGYPGVADYE